MSGNRSNWVTIRSFTGISSAVSGGGTVGFEQTTSNYIDDEAVILVSPLYEDDGLDPDQVCQPE